MATYEVDNWADLKTKVASVTSGDTVKVTADIDLNDGYSTGITNSDAINGLCTIDGDGHTIRNARFIGSNAALFQSGTLLTFRNIKLENIIIESGYFTNRVAFYDSDITVNFENNTALEQNAKISFDRCGVNIKGYGEVILDAQAHWLNDNNINIEGSFRYVKLAPRRTFISGDFSVLSNEYLYIGYAIKSVFVATFSGKIWGTTTSTYTKGCALDRSAATGNISYPDVFLLCNDPLNPNSPDIKSPSELAAAGFPIVPVVVGGE